LTGHLPNGTFKGVTAMIDKMGRVVVPKALRDHFALEAGSEMEITVEADGFRLRPISSGPVLEEKDGLLICTSELPSSAWDLGRFMDEQRNLRSKVLGGL
jgi:AbrB family looped-hinge helix DNA binding protein